MNQPEVPFRLFRMTRRPGNYQVIIQSVNFLSLPQHTDLTSPSRPQELLHVPITTSHIPKFLFQINEHE
jgi:hypothetical protein